MAFDTCRATLNTHFSAGSSWGDIGDGCHERGDERPYLHDNVFKVRNGPVAETRQHCRRSTMQAIVGVVPASERIALPEVKRS